MKLPMKPLILICAYLAKDILRRWLETPTAFLSRFLLCTSLCIFYILLSALFHLAEMNIQRKIDAMGLSTVLFKSFDNDEKKGVPQVGDLFFPLSREGIFLPFEDTFELGEMNGGKRCRVIVFDENSMPGMVRLSEKFAKIREPYFLLARGYPESFRLPVFLLGYVLEAEVVEPPPIFGLLAKNSAILMISREYAQGFGSGKRNEAFLFIGDNQLDLAVLLRSIRATLHAEGIERYELSSPMDWLGEVKNLREYRKECQLFAGLSIGLLILVSFSSIAVFEFRQNLYVLSLFKSFGVPAFLMFLRYWTEASIIALGSFLTAIELSIRLHFPLFESLKMEIRGFEIPLAVNFKPLENDQLIIILFCSVIISMIPVAWALRVPVGKTLS